MLQKERDILSIREQHRIHNEWMEKRINTLVPKLMKECGVDFWIVLCSEYNEDPVFRSLTPALIQFANRISCLAFYLDAEGNYTPYSLSRPNGNLKPYYKQAYFPKEEDQFDAIGKLVKQLNPKSIAVNVTSFSGQADGLSKRLYDKLKAAVGEKELIEDTQIAIRVLETRLDEELDMYPLIYKIANDIQKEAYSLDVITPGVTTTTEVEYFIMQRINDMGLTHWFSPDVDLQREGSSETHMSGVIIEKGDLLRTDMGLKYLGLCTDSQRLAYVLKDGETDVPEGIKKGLKRGNRFQDIVRENMKDGLSGNDIFTGSMEQAKKEGLRPMLYTHPIGVYGHAAGPVIGLYDAQRPDPLRGTLIFHEHTCHALELNVMEYVEDWKQDVGFFIEETIMFRDGEALFLDPVGRKQITLIG